MVLNAAMVAALISTLLVSTFALEETAKATLSKEQGVTFFATFARADASRSGVLSSAPLLLPVPLNSSMVGVIVNKPFLKIPGEILPVCSCCGSFSYGLTTFVLFKALVCFATWCFWVVPLVLDRRVGIFQNYFSLGRQWHFALTRKSQKKSSHKASLELSFGGNIFIFFLVVILAQLFQNMEKYEKIFAK